MFKQLRSLIKGSNKAVVKNDQNLKPFKATLLLLFRLIKEDKPVETSPESIKNILFLFEGKIKKRRLEEFFKVAAFRALFDKYSDTLIRKAYNPCFNRSSTKTNRQDADVPPEDPEYIIQKKAEYKEIVLDF